MAKTKRPASKPAAKLAVRSVADHLEAARAAAARGGIATVLDELRSAWRARPAAPLAEAIERFGARAKTSVHPPSGKTAAERNAAWGRAAASGDAVQLGVLLDTLTETRGCAETLERIELLLPFPDPRLAMAIADLIEVPRYNASVNRTNAFWKRMFALLADLGDPRLLERTRGFVAKWTANPDLNEPERPVLARKLAAVTPDLEVAYGQGPPALADHELELLAAVTAFASTTGPAQSERTEAELLAEIYANPDDDHVRMVYADKLLERGDPRGELITLQLAKARGETLGREQLTRERDLIAEHGKRWAGPLAKVITKKSMRFERGFLVSAGFNMATDAVKEYVIDESPEWATVREIGGAVPASDRCTLPSLRALVEVPSKAIYRLAQLTRPLAVERLHWYGPFWGSEDDAGLAAYASITVLPRLRELAIFGTWRGDLERASILWKAPVAKNLETLVVPAWLTAELHAALEPTRLRSVTFDCNSSWVSRLERAADGTLSRLTIQTRYHRPWETADILTALSRLRPATLTAVHATWADQGIQESCQPRLEAMLAKQTRLAAPAVYVNRAANAS